VRRRPVPMAVISAKNTSGLVKIINPDRRPIKNNVWERGFFR
jgi:hypothetical protein